MDNNHNTENFVPSVMAYHRAMATYRYTEALEHAKAAMESAPCDSEAASWARTSAELESKITPGITKIIRALGFGGAR